MTECRSVGTHTSAFLADQASPCPGFLFRLDIALHRGPMSAPGCGVACSPSKGRTRRAASHSRRSASTPWQRPELHQPGNFTLRRHVRTIVSGGEDLPQRASRRYPNQRTCGYGMSVSTGLDTGLVRRSVRRYVSANARGWAYASALLIYNRLTHSLVVGHPIISMIAQWPGTVESEQQDGCSVTKKI